MNLYEILSKATGGLPISLTPGSSSPSSPTYQLPNGAGSYNTIGTSNAGSGFATPTQTLSQGMAGGNDFTPEQAAAVKNIASPAPVQTPTTATNQTQPMMVDHNAAADLINSGFYGTQPSAQGPVPAPDQSMTPGAQPGYSPGTAMPSSYLQQFYQLRRQQADDRMNNTGLYAVDPSAGYSPDQVRQIHDSADQIYNNTLDALAFGAQREIYQMKNGIAGDLAQLNPATAQYIQKMGQNFSSQNKDAIVTGKQIGRAHV